MQADILNLINDSLGFEYEQETPWYAVFAEPPTSPRARPASAAAAPLTFSNLADLLACTDLPDSDSADSSYRRVSFDRGCERLYVLASQPRNIIKSTLLTEQLMVLGGMPGHPQEVLHRSCCPSVRLRPIDEPLRMVVMIGPCA